MGAPPRSKALLRDEGRPRRDAPTGRNQRSPKIYRRNSKIILNLPLYAVKDMDGIFNKREANRLNSHFGPVVM